MSEKPRYFHGSGGGRFFFLISLGMSLTFLTWPIFGASRQDVDNPRPEKIVFHSTYQTPEIVSGYFAASSAATMEQKSYDFFAARNELFKINRPDQELDLIKQSTDDLGLTHLRFQQSYNGIRVWGCQTIVHFEDDNTIYLVGGQTIASPDLNTVPSLDESAASDEAVSSLKSESLPDQISTESEPVIYPNDGDPKLAWLVTVTSPINGSVRWLVFVDAQSGIILHKFNDIHFDGPDTGSGPDVLGVPRTFPIYYRNGQYQMIDATLPMFSPPIDYLKGVIVTYDDFYAGGPISTDPDGDKVWDDTERQQAEVSGHVFTRMVYEYFYNTFGRSSYDGMGSTIIVNCHDPVYTNNAYWNGISINFADGDGVNFRPFSAALDVVAHELTHGVTSYTADLIYQYQPGALSEHFSDFFGLMLDPEDWLMGEDLFFGGGFIRNMQDPSAGGDPEHMNQYMNLDISNDNGGVHINCGIPNLAAYLAINDTDIGFGKAEQIWYRALTTYLTPTSGFYFWAGMIMQSTNDLYGSAEMDAINTALDAVGLNTVYTDPEYPEVATIIGSSTSSSVWVHNPGPGAKQVSAVAPTIPGVTITPGPGYQEIIPEGGSSEFSLGLDAGALDECNVGAVHDSLRFDVSGSINTQIKLPLTAKVGYTTSQQLSTVINSGCVSAYALNTSAIWNFSRDAFDVLYDGSLMAAWNEGGEIEAYRHLYGEQKFTPVDEILQGEGERSFRIASYDARIQGGVTYRVPVDAGDGCLFIIADYFLYNPCNSPTTIFSGVYMDFDIDAHTDLVSYDAVKNMIYMTNQDDTHAAGVALLSGDAFNMRALHNPDVVYDGFTDETAYWQMAATFNTDGPDPSDWSVLLTFGQDELSPGDTAFYSVAFLYSSGGSSELPGILAEAQAWFERVPYICGDTNGDESINIGDVVYLVNLVFHEGPMPDPEAAGDVNCDGNVNIGDAVYMANYIFQEEAPVPCADCPVK